MKENSVQRNYFAIPSTHPVNTITDLLEIDSPIGKTPKKERRNNAVELVIYPAV